MTSYDQGMEITIGLKDVTSELTIDSDLTADAVAQLLSTALSTGATGVLDLSDAKGQRILIPAQAIAYVQLGNQSPRKVGFGSM